METKNLTQWSTKIYDLSTWLEAFLVDRKAQNMSAGTVRFYKFKLKLFSDYCESQVITEINQITPVIIRNFLLHLEETKHNPGGIHAAYRALRAFFLWWEDEYEPENWKNPIRKVKAPRMATEPLEPVELDTIKKLLTADGGEGFTNYRDHALIYFLLDTGVRAAECLALNNSDVNLITGEILIRVGKGRKPRTVYLEKTARKALRAYLKQRSDTASALWITDAGERLGYSGLREMIHRRSTRANVTEPTLHDFRRAFAINCLRNGMDLITLSRLMGHADLQVLKRYLKQSSIDLATAHNRSSPVERGGL